MFSSFSHRVPSLSRSRTRIPGAVALILGVEARGLFFSRLLRASDFDMKEVVN